MAESDLLTEQLNDYAAALRFLVETEQYAEFMRWKAAHGEGPRTEGR